MAQELDEVQEVIKSPEPHSARRTDKFGERRSPGGPSFWNYAQNFSTIVWSEAIKKEAKGLHGADLGRVQAVEAHYVRTVKGLIRKDTFYIPRDLAQAFDGSTLWFHVEPGFEHEFRRMNPPAIHEMVRASRARAPENRPNGKQTGRDGLFLR